MTMTPTKQWRLVPAKLRKMVIDFFICEAQTSESDAKSPPERRHFDKSPRESFQEAKAFRVAVAVLRRAALKRKASKGAAKVGSKKANRPIRARSPR